MQLICSASWAELDLHTLELFKPDRDNEIEVRRHLQAVFSPPIQHNLRVSEIEALLLHLGTTLEACSDHRLKIQLASGERLVLHAASGLHHPYLDEEGIVRLRRFLQQACLTPEHHDPGRNGVHGDQARRLVIHLDHHGARLWRLEGQEFRQSDLRPEDLWGSGRRSNTPTSIM